MNGRMEGCETKRDIVKCEEGGKITCRACPQETRAKRHAPNAVRVASERSQLNKFLNDVITNERFASFFSSLPLVNTQNNNSNNNSNITRKRKHNITTPLNR